MTFTLTPKEYAYIVHEETENGTIQVVYEDETPKKLFLEFKNIDKNYLHAMNRHCFVFRKSRVVTETPGGKL